MMEVSDATKEYELSFVLRSEEGGNTASRVLGSHEAQVTFQSPLNKVTLAYPIKRVTSAFFGYATFVTEPDRIAQIDHDLTISPDVVRFLMITPPIGKQKARTMLSPRRPSMRPSGDEKPIAAQPLSNEALEKKLEEILQ